MTDTLAPPSVCCHHTAFKKRCRDLVSKGICNRWMQIQGHNPQTGEQISKWDCVDNWTPMLLIENSQMQRQTGAAVESFRNEFVRENAQTLHTLRQTQLAAQAHMDMLNDKSGFKAIEARVNGEQE